MAVPAHRHSIYCLSTPGAASWTGINTLRCIAGGHSAIRAASSIMDTLCKALGDMPDDVDHPPAFGDNWASDGFDVSGLDPTESDLNMTGCSTAAEGPSYRSYRCAQPAPS